MSEQRIGKVLQVIGPVVDVEFDAGNLPNIMSALMISNPAISEEADNLVVEVAQHLGDNVVRCIAQQRQVFDELLRSDAPTLLHEFGVVIA